MSSCPAFSSRAIVCGNQHTCNSELTISESQSLIKSREQHLDEPWRSNATYFPNHKMTDGFVTSQEYDYVFPNKTTEYLHIFFIRINSNETWAQFEMCADFPSNVIIKITGLGSPHTHLSHLYQKDFAVAKTFMSPIMSYLEAALKLPFFFFFSQLRKDFIVFPIQ